MQSRPHRPPLAAGTGLVSSHRVQAQTLSPADSECPDAGGPISRPPGSLAHSPPGMLGPPPSANPLTGRYGLSAGAWAKHDTSVASSATMPHNAIHPKRFRFDMTHLSSGENGVQGSLSLSRALGNWTAVKRGAPLVRTWKRGFAGLAGTGRACFGDV